MAYETKTVDVRRTKDGAPYEQDLSQVEALEDKGFECYDKPGRPALSKHGGWEYRLARRTAATDAADAATVDTNDSISSTNDEDV